MAGDQFTKHLVFDVHSNLAYGLKLDESGNCVDAEALNIAVRRRDGRLVEILEPDARDPKNPMGPPIKNPLPYGKTTYAVEAAEGPNPARVYTVVWPTLEDVEKGAKPQVSRADLPADLSKGGFAPPPKGTSRRKQFLDEDELNLALGNINRMIGLDGAKRKIGHAISMARFNAAKKELKIKSKPVSNHMVFTGNPGTGKTTFAREVAKAYYALGYIDAPEVHEVSRKDVVGRYVGETAQKMKDEIEKAIKKGGILFIDEAYSLADKEGQGKYGQEAIDTLVAEMENRRDQLIVIVAGYPDEMKAFIDANPGLKDRFKTFIPFEDYTLPQLGQILDVMLEDYGPYTMTPDARKYAMQAIEDEMNRVEKKNFGNGRVVRNLVEMAEEAMAARLDAEGLFGKNHGLTDEERARRATTITLDDIKSIDLAGINQKMDSSSFGLGRGVPRNDNTTVWEVPAPQIRGQFRP